MLQSQIIQDLHDRQPRVLFQLDGNPPHRGLRVKKALDGHCQIVGLTARSSDITPLDFFLR